MKKIVSLGIALQILFLSACGSSTQNLTHVDHTDAPITLSVPADSTLRKTHEATGTDFMIASQGEATTKAAARMFKLGGNIIDAAIAASFTLSVERPQSTGLGGGGFMLLKLSGKKNVIAVDFREMAPSRAHERMFQDKEGNIIANKSTDGVAAAGVPGLVAGLLDIHNKYGKLSRETVLQPAIELAEEGFPVYKHLANALAERREVLEKFPASRAIYLKDGEPYEIGDKLIQADLAKSLRAIAKEGKDVFYKGWIAEAIVKDSGRWAGYLQMKDFQNYRVRYRQPVRGSYRGYDVYSMPPPSSGGVHILEILNIVEPDPLRKWGPHSAQSVHRIASAMHLAFADRAKHLGDPDFVTVPTRGLISKDYAKSLRQKIPAQKALIGKEVNAGDPTPHEPDQTTHFTIMDRAGNVVTSTQTINGIMGSGWVASGTGIMMNNEMDDFSVKPGVPNSYGVVGGKQNAVQAKKRPLSSMSPTIVMKNKEPVFATGSPSGPRILTCVTHTLLNYFEFGLPLYESVAAVRYHHQWTPDEIRMDEPGLPSETVDRLTAMGYKFKTSSLGCQIQAIAKESHGLRGVSDPRGEGLALGQ